ncbi:MAG: YihY/virulence factor BrkB family protein [Synechococcales cyanobacterium K44_A2020_017]|jgi:membrane protein|nr:YihY/virulence factor BrkB family protein [Synechococcales cyanobacterium K32_A2020_035]MBF2094183.1 YihY/virulence factor BrkB family protein [Synechococcales cyanobacterium K44_A2020_017]
MYAPRFVRFFQHINLTTLRRVIKGVMAQRLPSLSAEMAYNALLALFPAVLTVLTAVSLFEPLTNSFERLMGRLSEVAPVDALNLIENFASDITTGGSSGLFSVSFLIALWVSSSALSAAMRALDQIHQIPQALMRPFWKAKLISLGLTLGTILLLMLASTLVFISDWAISNLAIQSSTFAPWLLQGWRWLTWPFALGIMSLAFAFIYRFGPSRWSPNKPLFPGAVLAAISWALISNGFRLYVLHFGNYNKVYGTVGAVIVLQLWLYMSSLVMLIGDQVNVTVGEAMQKSDRQRLAADPSEPKPRRSKSSTGPGVKRPSRF